MKLGALLLILCAVPGFTQTAGSGVMLGSGVVFGGYGGGTSGGGSPTGIVFSPVAGTYTGAQSIGISAVPADGLSMFYTADGTTPSYASTVYSSPVTVSASETLKAITASTGTVAQSINATSAKWKIVTKSVGTHNGITSEAGGGVGTIQPSDWNYTFGTTMSESVSTTASTGETQILYVHSDTPCNDCEYIAQDKWVQAVGDNTIIANNEMDMLNNDASRVRLHMFGLQCNQQPGHSGGMQWQIDNQQGSWQNTGITDGCPLNPSNWLHVVFEGHWDTSDTSGCSGASLYNNNGNSTGYGCEYFDALTVTVCSAAPVSGKCPSGNVVSGPTRHALGVTMNSYTEPGWSSLCGNQDQIDLTNTATSGHNPTTGGRNIKLDNVSCAYSTDLSGSAAYTIH